MYKDATKQVSGYDGEYAIQQRDIIEITVC